MENDLSTDAIGVPARPETEGVGMSQEEIVDSQAQTHINPDPSGSGIPQELHATGCTSKIIHTCTQSQSDTVSDVSDSLLKENIPDPPSKLLDLSTADSISNKWPTEPDKPEVMLDESKTSNPVDPCLTEQVSDIQKFKENLKQDKNIISKENNRESNISSVQTRYAPRNLSLLPRPPLEWRLNELLDEIALSIDPTEFSRVKLMFTGPQSLGKAILEQCDTCLKLFTVLKERGYISRDNILYLNKILYILGRQDLIERTVQYCRDEGDVIHYYSVQGEPDTGNRHIRIHVVADVPSFDQEKKERLRNYVACIVCAPAEVVIISAVEPGSSLLITLTMPDMYVDVLKHLLEKKDHLWRLVALEVDIIIIDGVRYAVSGQCTDMKVTEQYKDVMNVYEQLKETRKELEQMETVTLQCREELNNARSQLDEAEAKVKIADSLVKTNQELATTRSMLQSLCLTSEISESALVSFRLIVKEAIDKGQDVDLLNRIVKCNTEIVDGYHRVCKDIEQEKQNTKLKENRINEKWLRQQLAANLKSATEILMLKYSQYTLDTKLTFNTNATSTLNEMTEKLTSDEVNILMNRYKLADEDVIKACIDADKRLLLLGLECKEVEQTQKRVDTKPCPGCRRDRSERYRICPYDTPGVVLKQEKNTVIDKFLRDLGREINRDLCKMYTEKMKEKNEETEQKKIKEHNKELLQQLQSKLKCPEEILLCLCDQFVGIVNADGRPVAKEAITNAVKLTLIKCKGLCHFLKEGEISNLKSLTSPEDDVIQACIKEDKRLLLSGLMLKHIERSKMYISTVQFVANLQNDLKRGDLLNLFMWLQNDETEQQKQIANWHDKNSAEPELLHMLTSEHDSAEDVLLKKFQCFTLKLVDKVETRPGFNELAKLLSGLSAKLNEDEKEQLTGLYQWDENDVIKACINADIRLLLFGLYCKETEMTQKAPQLEPFVPALLGKAKRMDLVDEFRCKSKLALVDVDMLHHVMDMVFDYSMNSGKFQDYTKQLLQEVDSSPVHVFTGLRYQTPNSGLKYKTTETTVKHLLDPVHLD